MNTKWRPEGWDEQELETNCKLAEKLGMPLGSPSLGMVQAYEAGADAMLEALKKHGMKVLLTNGVIGLVEPQYAMSMLTKGKLVFIPDEKEVIP